MDHEGKEVAKWRRNVKLYKEKYIEALQGQATDVHDDHDVDKTTLMMIVKKGQRQKEGRPTTAKRRVSSRKVGQITAE